MGGAKEQERQRELGESVKKALERAATAAFDRMVEGAAHFEAAGQRTAPRGGSMVPRVPVRAEGLRARRALA